MSSVAESIALLARRSFEASQTLSSEERINALKAIRSALELAKQEVLAENAKDVEAAKKLVNEGKMESATLKRLDLQSSADKYDSMLQGISDVADLPDPAGQVSYASKLDDELELYKVSCPIGVLLVIFEARPEVIANITALAVKSGNAAILKGGKESLHTQAVMTKAIQAALSTTRVPKAYIQTVETREDVSALLSQDQYIDLVIPRGSNSLVKSIQNSTKIPVMGHADGICSVYLDESAVEDKALKVVLDSKLTYPAACNAAETLLIHESLLDTLWPTLARALLSASVTLKCDTSSLASISSHPLIADHEAKPTHLTESTEEDYKTEFLNLTLAVKAVPSLVSAIEHINSHSSHHTDCIMTESKEAASTFCRAVDSAGVYVNASTRFADGFRYGFGTEVGVSTGKIHARGPVGLEGLMIYKYQIVGRGKQGHATADYGSQGKTFKHEKMQVKEAPF